MRKHVKSPILRIFFIVFICLFACSGIGKCSDVPGVSPGVEAAQNEYARIKSLVESGMLPKIRLDQAAAELADAQDQAILLSTLYSSAKIQDMTADQAQAMLDAARRRVDREAKIVQKRRAFVESGMLAKSEFQAFQNELEARQRAVGLAENRIRLLEEIRQMAEAEQRLEREAQNGVSGARGAEIRYDGSGVFELTELPVISNAFQKQFHRALPVSAIGQTAVHQAMGLDHRNRVDVAVNPDQPEGQWLRLFLERLQIPYLAFRSAVAGAATAPHVHIGLGSTRLKLARR